MSIQIELALSGVDQLKQTLERLTRAFPLAMREALYEEALIVEAESVKLVPVKHGRLRGTHLVTLVGELYEPQAIISYGTSYGIYVHERLELKHKAPTQSKFLEKPLNDRRDKFLSGLSVRVQAKVRLK